MRVQALWLVVAVAAACTKPVETAPAAAEAREDDPRPAATERVVPAFVGETVEVLIVQRSYVGWGSAHRVALAGERGMLYAGVGTPLSAAAEANDRLTVELGTEPATEADHPNGALVRDGSTYRIASVTAWMQPADTVSHDTLVGVWRVPKAGRERWSPAGMRTVGVPQFAYDGLHVVLKLEGTRHELESRWAKQSDGREELQYRAPSGAWVTLAASVFEGKSRRFVAAEADATWPLERVRKPADADADDLALVAPPR